MPSPRISLIESYVTSTQVKETAHDYKHVDRVRRWALKIATSVGYPDRDIVEAAALLHDIGLAQAERKNHAEVGGDVAARYLTVNRLFAGPEIDQIAYAICSHTSIEDHGTLASILKDADILDMLGAVGIMRAFTSKHMLDEYDPVNVRGETWGNTNDDTTRRFASGAGIGPTIVDQINFQISCQGNLQSDLARSIAGPLVEYMRSFVLELEREVIPGA